MHDITDREAQFRLEKLLDTVQFEPVAITKDGERIAVLVSANEYADMQDIHAMWLRLVALPRAMRQTEAQQHAEIERRIAEVDAGTVKTVAWDEVRTELHSSFKANRHDPKETYFVARKFLDSATGMFDDLQCNAPLPPNDQVVPDFSFRTKSLSCTMERFTITAEGRLVLHRRRFECTGETERTRHGMMPKTRVFELGELDLNYHGDIRFSGEQLSEAPAQYLARFTHGQLESIRLVKEKTSTRDYGLFAAVD